MHFTFPRHRRVILTDFTGGTNDVQNEARCSSFGERHCTGVCPRHDPVTYADQQARHATDSIDAMAERFHTFGITR